MSPRTEPGDEWLGMGFFIGIYTAKDKRYNPDVFIVYLSTFKKYCEE